MKKILTIIGPTSSGKTSLAGVATQLSKSIAGTSTGHGTKLKITDEQYISQSSGIFKAAGGQKFVSSKAFLSKYFSRRSTPSNIFNSGGIDK